MSCQNYYPPCRFPRLWAISLLGFALSFSGCSDNHLIETYPTTGKISFQGRPITNARIWLTPIHGDENLKKVLPKATVSEDGTFSIGTYLVGDGAPVGEYKMCVVWPNGPDEESEKPGYVSDQLRGRFANPDRTTLQVTIEAGVNEIPEIILP